MQSILVPLLFLSEVYLLISHGLVLTRIYQPTQSNLAKMGMWFLFDGLSGFSILYVLSDLLLGTWYSYYVLVHLIGHLFYVVTWKDGYYSKRIRNWSSIDFSTGPWVTIDFGLTIFDMSVHAVNAYLLYDHMMKFNMALQ